MVARFIILVLIIFIFMVKPDKNVYNVSYILGLNFLKNITPNPNYAVMFDIDDTLLESITYKPIKPIIKLIKECNKKGIKVLIITARDSKYTFETIEDLVDIDVYPNPDVPDFKNLNISVPNGAPYYDFIYLRENPKDNNDQFKSKVKEKLAKNGLYTVMSIGDNEVDVLGDYSGYAIKLPNKLDPRLFHKDASGRMVHVKL
jgi:predicted secreted acid phosphatase